MSNSEDPEEGNGEKPPSGFKVGVGGRNLISPSVAFVVFALGLADR